VFSEKYDFLLSKSYLLIGAVEEVELVLIEQEAAAVEVVRP
jgi:hypothetical protein